MTDILRLQYYREEQRILYKKKTVKPLHSTRVTMNTPSPHEIKQIERVEHSKIKIHLRENPWEFLISFSNCTV